ncbi:hypothetical protein V7127_03105 [Bacillus sp. JJ1773]
MLYVIRAFFTITILISIFVVKPDKVYLESEESNRKEEMAAGQSFKNKSKKGCLDIEGILFCALINVIFM